MHGGQASNYRNVQYEASWEADLVQLRGGVPAPAPVDEVIESLDWTLGRLADDYPLVGATGFRVMNIPSARDVPALEAWFTVKSDRVCCHRLLVAETAAEEDGPDPAGEAF
jgi:hypothetical protein